VLENIYLAFTGGKKLADAQKRRRTFLSCISAPEGEDFSEAPTEAKNF